MNAVKTLSAQHHISVLCRVLRVNRSTYYKWLNHLPSRRELENRAILSYILEIYSKADKRLGAQKIAVCLKRDYCIHISCGRVYRLMKTMNLPKMSTVKPPKRSSAKAEDCHGSNILAQNFDQPAPNMVWVSDFTYIRAAGRFYYLCAILDLFSRKVIAFKVSDKIDTDLAIETLSDAIAARDGCSGLIFHSEQRFTVYLLFCEASVFTCFSPVFVPILRHLSAYSTKNDTTCQFTAPPRTALLVGV